jgi:exoribonuclease II
MVAANHCFGKYIKDNNVKAIYNKFLGYSDPKKEELLEIINKYKLSIKESDLYTFKGYKKIQKKLLKQPENVVTLFNRCLEKAILSEKQVPHYGLGLEEGYATFTSPLRKYIDLINHRILKSLLRNEEIYKFNNEYLIELKANQLKQRRAENYIKQHLYSDYMYGKRNIDYKGKVVFMNSKGAKIQIEENGVTGLLPFEKILKINFEYIQSERVMNINSNVVKIGDVFNISLRNIDKYTKEINIIYYINLKFISFVYLSIFLKLILKTSPIFTTFELIFITLSD